jgi:hypothetical protein
MRNLLVEKANYPFLLFMDCDAAVLSNSYINNPLYHDGLDTNEDYLKKVETSIDNLITLLNANKIDSRFVNENRLLDTYFKCKRLKSISLLQFFYKIFLHKIKQKILKKHSIFWLDVYKLGYLLQNV